MTVTCQYAAWRDQVRLLVPIDAEPVAACAESSTHLATTQHHRPGLLTTTTVHVCVWHAELIRQGTPGVVTLPHRPLTVAALES